MKKTNRYLTVLKKLPAETQPFELLPGVETTFSEEGASGLFATLTCDASRAEDVENALENDDNVRTYSIESV